MPSPFKHRNLPHLLLSARETLMLRFRPLLLSENLNEQQWRVLRTLYDVTTSDAATLAQDAQILAPSLTRMLRSLEEAQLIQRQSDPKDLRRQIIGLSLKGRDLVTRLSPDIDRIYETLEHELGQDLLQTLYDNVDILLERLHKHE